MMSTKLSQIQILNKDLMRSRPSFLEGAILAESDSPLYSSTQRRFDENEEMPINSEAVFNTNVFNTSNNLGDSLEFSDKTCDQFTQTAKKRYKTAGK